ncbi:MAG: hypothetical protein GY765_26345, partial [bacterium]|nr:hypothetical protein [bacterium]
MKRMFLLVFAIMTLLIFISPSASESKQFPGATPSKYAGEVLNKTSKGMNTQSRVNRSANFGKMPLYFIQNLGQVNAESRYYAKASRYTLWLTKKGLVFDSYKSKTADKKAPFRDVSRLMFQGARKSVEILPIEPTPLKVNFFKGNDKSKWRGGVPTAGAVLYRNLYKNIDLKVYGIEKEIEYDWIVKKGADPSTIRFHYDNVKSTRIDKEGNLRITTNFGDLVHKRPVGFQQINNKRVAVDVRFKRIKGNTYGFGATEYDRNYSFIIDPVVIPYSTYLGGDDGEIAYRIRRDASGYLYVCGYTRSTDFPDQNEYMSDPGDSAFDIYVSKIDPTQSGHTSLLYSTYLGGSSTDTCRDIDVGTGGIVYVAGKTNSTDFPTVNEYMTDPGDGSGDGFVVKIDTTQSGGSSLLYSTYMGGDDSDSFTGIKVDSGGLVYVSGSVYSTDFPILNAYDSTHNCASDIVVLQMDLDQSGASSLLYSSFLGGSGSDGQVYISVDAAGLVYLFGYTLSIDFPVVNQYMSDPGDVNYDFFLSKLDLSLGASGLLFSTYLGGDQSDSTSSGGIAVDNSGNAYITGTSQSSDFPTVNEYMTEPGDGNSDDIVLAKVDTTQSGAAALPYSTYIGGTSGDSAGDIALDSNNYVYLSGRSSSTNFPTVKEYMTDPGDSADDGVVMIMDPTNSGSDSLLLSSYFGASDEDDVAGIAVDSSGNIYIFGDTDSTDFPVVNEYMSDPGDSESDAFVTHLQLTGPTVTTDALSNIEADTAEGEIADAVFPVTDRGFCRSTSVNPTTSDTTLSVGTGEGVFSGNLTGLTANTTYYVRSYAVNYLGTHYGNEVSFVSGTAVIPSVSSDAAYNITTTTADGGGTVSDDGGAAVTARGLCWNTSGNPTTADTTLAVGTGTGAFSDTMTPLTASTTYYVRAYAVNSVGTAYGNQVSFTTLTNPVVPTVTTDAAYNIALTTADSGGAVS